MNKSNAKIAIVGLGYVGLPLAKEFAKKYNVTGYDINKKRVEELKIFKDSTNEVEIEDLKRIICNEKIPHYKNGFYPTTNDDDISDCNIYIITVPTPVNKNKQPNLNPLKNASKLVASKLNKSDIVIYESTVYPGATEEECVPIIESISGLVYNKDFFVGYSPERINPGDKIRTLTKITKITSGSNYSTAVIIDNLYKSIIKAGTYMAPSIKVAEAAKVIENSQRDINIAFMNELAKIFNLLEIDTNEVLKAAGTKWNFLNYTPGLVGGHCIGVDPYYIAQKAQEVGYHPEIILAGRKINDSMGDYVANRVVSYMLKNEILLKGAKVLVLGITFKENCPDIRNTKVIDLINTLQDFRTDITVYDPVADPEIVLKEYNLKTCKSCPKNIYDAIILAVPHKEFSNIDFQLIKHENTVIYDVKGFLNFENVKRL